MSEKRFKKYRKKPIIVEAYQADEEKIIETLEGKMKANKGDYIIRGIKGELYPCKADIFYKTYDKVENDTQYNEVAKQEYMLTDFDSEVELLEKINEQQVTIQSLKEENEELKRKLEDYEYEHFLDNLGSSNKWFGMGGF